jgi:hypothetical protein
MNRWIELVMTHMLPWPIGVLVGASALSLVIGLIGLWSLWRVRRLLAGVTLVQERLTTLSNSVALLTDTTESCFRAVSMQMQFLQSPGGRAATRRPTQAPEAPVESASARKARQRRVVGAARRGDALAAIAAREDLAETEVALRLHVGREQQAPEPPKRYGSMFS